MNIPSQVMCPSRRQGLIMNFQSRTKAQVIATTSVIRKVQTHAWAADRHPSAKA